jgi:hypothetical protein
VASRHPWQARGDRLPDGVRASRKDDAPTREVRSKVTSGATTADGATHAMAASYQYFRDIHEAGPDTVAAWTSVGVNGMQIGPEVVT